MASNTLTTKKSSFAMWKRLGRMIRAPGDIPFSFQLAYFIWRVPAWLDRMTLPQLLHKLQAASRPPAPSVDASLERVQRLARPWFKVSFLRNRNTCYLRALMFYRFLDSQNEALQIHFVVEPSRAPGARLHGHAWVSVGARLIEPPLSEIVARTHNIYTFPTGKK